MFTMTAKELHICGRKYQINLIISAVDMKVG